jgi:ABC-type transporter Mla MlaB component
LSFAPYGDLSYCQPLEVHSVGLTKATRLRLIKLGAGRTYMLRITSLDELDRVTLKLEGSLVGIWVTELEEIWRSIYSRLEGRPLYLNMNGVGHVDRAGTYLLALLRHRGARLITSGPLMMELVRAIKEDWPTVDGE